MNSFSYGQNTKLMENNAKAFSGANVSKNYLLQSYFE